jgi:hypothetical protein
MACGPSPGPSRSGSLGIDVLVTNELEVFTLDSAHRLFVARAIGRKFSLVLISISDSLNQHLNIVGAAISL